MWKALCVHECIIISELYTYLLIIIILPCISTFSTLIVLLHRFKQHQILTAGDWGGGVLVSFTISIKALMTFKNSLPHDDERYSIVPDVRDHIALRIPNSNLGITSPWFFYTWIQIEKKNLQLYWCFFHTSLQVNDIFNVKY